jgi:hypothetical protein
MYDYCGIGLNSVSSIISSTSITAFINKRASGYKESFAGRKHSIAVANFGPCYVWLWVTCGIAEYGEGTSLTDIL